jgi:hypothetical protein
MLATQQVGPKGSYRALCLLNPTRCKLEIRYCHKIKSELAATVCGGSRVSWQPNDCISDQARLAYKELLDEGNKVRFQRVDTLQNPGHRIFSLAPAAPAPVWYAWPRRTVIESNISIANDSGVAIVQLALSAALP